MLSVIAAFGIWRGRGWAVWAIGVLGLAVVTTTLLEGFLLGGKPPFLAASQALVAVVVTTGVTFLLRRELDDRDRKPAERG
jgi:hypothetical protein